MKSMRKLGKMIAATVFAVTMTVGMAFTTFAATNEKNAEYTKVNVAQVEDITDLLNVSDSGAVNKLENIDGEGLYSYYYTFKLSKASYVDIKSYAKLVNYNFQADMMLYLGTDKTFAASPVIESWMDGDGKEYKTMLEAGTYYIKICCDIHKDADFTNEKTVNFAIYTQPINRSGAKGSTMKTAMTIKNTTIGCVTSTSKNQWFKINAPQKSDVTLKSVITAPTQWNEGRANVCAYDKNGAMISSKVSMATNSNNSATITLKGVKGTVYVCVAAESGVFNVSQTAVVKDKYKPSAPSVSPCKKGAKVVSGKGEANANVIVKFNGKTYKGKVDKKGKFKVNVAALKAGSKVVVSLKDAAGNTSAAKTVVVR